MDIIWKGIFGGLVTAAIARLPRRGNILPAPDLTTIPIPGFEGEFAVACAGAKR
jgi:hypothetical protein